MFRDFQRCEACSRNIRWLFGSGLKIWDVKFEIFEYVSLRFENWDLEVWGLRFKIWGLWFEVWRFRCEIWDLGFEFENWDFVLKFEVWSLKFGFGILIWHPRVFQDFFWLTSYGFPWRFLVLRFVILRCEVWVLRFQVWGVSFGIWDLSSRFEIWGLRFEGSESQFFYKIFEI